MYLKEYARWLEVGVWIACQFTQERGEWGFS